MRKNSSRNLNLENIKVVLIVTTGRTGSDYLQHCLDGLKGLMVVSDKFHYHQFFKNKNEKKDPFKVLNAFIKKYSNLFSQIEIENIKINLNIKKFRKNFEKLAGKKKISRKQFFVLVHMSYHLTAGRSLKDTRTIIHNSHGINRTIDTLEDFPNAKILVTVRDPLSNLKSGLINWFRYKTDKINMLHAYTYMYRIRQDLKFLLKLKNKKFFVKMEEANLKRIKKRICNFINIKFQKKIYRATVLNKPWVGDQLSKRQAKKGEFLKPENKNEYENFYSKKDIKTLSYLYKDYRIFNYKLKKIRFLNGIQFLLNSLFLLSFEKDIMNYNQTKSLKKLNIKYYLYRIFYFIIISLKLDFLIKNKHLS
tara:strand:- start:479 stop:1570 length:1092 start_codon:yes stop_codon:yes gene_type:complete